jgi:hypothetical protein
MHCLCEIALTKLIHSIFHIYHLTLTPRFGFICQVSKVFKLMEELDTKLLINIMPYCDCTF